MVEAPLTRDQAKALLNECLRDGRVIYTAHFKRELANDALNLGDVRWVCRCGAIMDAPEPDIRTGAWKYRIEGYSADGQRLAVVFRFGRDGESVMITVFRR